MQNGHAAMETVIHGVGYFFITLGDDEELNGLMRAPDDIVDHKRSDECEADTLDDEFGGVEEEVGAGDDADVGELEGTT